MLFGLVSNCVPLPSVLLVSYQPARVADRDAARRDGCGAGADDEVGLRIRRAGCRDGAAGVSLLQAASGSRRVNTSNRPDTVIM